MERDMNNNSDGLTSRLIGNFVISMRNFLFRILCLGPIPIHLAFILDGNRRYAKKWNLTEGTGHKAGFFALMSTLKYCYELGVKYVTIYAFSIDNFRRRPNEVKYLMDLMYEKIEGLLKEERIVTQFGVRLYFIGNLKLLPDNVRIAAEKAMKATASNNKAVLLICVAYSATDEITHAAQESCLHKWDKIQALKANAVHSDEISNENHESFQNNGDDIEALKAIAEDNGEINNEKQEEHRFIKIVDLEKYMYMGVAPDPDILFRTSGETRLSNFLLWQTSNCILYSPRALFPELGLKHIVWAVLNYQRSHSYTEKKKKQL